MCLNLDVYCSFICDVDYFVDYFENSPTFHHSTPDPHSKQKKRKNEKGTKKSHSGRKCYSVQLQNCQLVHFSIYESK